MTELAGKSAADGLSLEGAMAGMLLVLAVRLAKAALCELRAAEREWRDRQRYHARARAKLTRAIETARYPEYIHPFQARCVDAADRVLRAQRRAIEAQRALDDWTAELEVTLRELGPVSDRAWTERSARLLREADRERIALDRALLELR